VIELHAGGACYSWRLPPSRQLGGVISTETRKKPVRFSREELCEGHCACPMGTAKSNSSRARHEGRQVVWPCQVLDVVVSTPCGIE
jgi:hypothetical protein